MRSTGCSNAAHRGCARGGYAVAIDHRSRGGWPVSATLRLDGLRLDGPARADPADASTHNLTLHWRAQSLVMQASPRHPFQVTLVARGTQLVSLDGLPGLTLWGDRLAAGLPWRTDADALRLPIEARAVHAAIGAAGPDWVTTLAGARGSLLFSAGGNLAVRLTLDALTLPQAGPHPFGRTLDRVELAAALPPGLDTPAWPGTGPLLLQNLSLDWSDLHLNLRGSLQADPGSDRPPQGRFALSVRGVRTALRAAAGNGDLSRGEAMALNGLAGLLEQAGDGGGIGGDTLRDLPVLLHDNVLWLGTVPLWRLH